MAPARATALVTAIQATVEIPGLVALSSATFMVARKSEDPGATFAVAVALLVTAALPTRVVMAQAVAVVMVTVTATAATAPPAVVKSAPATNLALATTSPALVKTRAPAPATRPLITRSHAVSTRRSLAQVLELLQPSPQVSHLGPCKALSTELLSE